MPRSFLMKFKDDKWKNSRATMSTRDSINAVVPECACISEENPKHLECGARSKLKELKSESITEVHRKSFDCNNNNNNGDRNNGRQDLDQSSVKFKSHWGVKEVFASVNKNNLNNDVSRLGLCKNNYISTDDNFNNNNNNSDSNGNKIVFCSEVCGTNTATINGLSKKRHNVLKSSSSSHSSIKWSSPSSLSSSSSSSVRPSQPKTSKGLSDIRRKIWSPPKDLEPRSAGNVDQNRKLGDAQHGGPSKFDASITPIHMFSNPFFPPQYLHPFHQSSFFFRPMVFDERVLYRASNMNLTNLYQPALSHLYPLTSYQQGNYGNLQIMTPPPQALTPPTSIHKMTPDGIADHDKRAATATPSTKHHSTVTVDSFQKSFPSPVSPVEMEKPSQTFKVTSNALNNLTVNQNSSNQSRSTNKIAYHASKFSGNFYENSETGNSNSNNCKASADSVNKSSASSKSSVNGVRRSATKRSSSFQEGVTIGYTYDAFFVSDGRSKRRNQSLLLSTVNNQQSDLTSSMDSSASGDHSNISTSRSATNPESTSSKSGYQQQFFTIAQHLLGQSSDNRTRYKCSECGKHYATSSNLSRHKQTHRSLDSQQAKRCPHCGKVYVSMPALSMHVLTHDLKYQCRVCQKSFSRPWLLQGHLRSHTGEKPFGCAHCGKAFADRSNLRAHMQTHSSFKLHTCKRCCKSFALKAYLNKHQESACYKDDEAAAKLDASCSNSSCSVMGSGANNGVNDGGASGSVGAGDVGSCGDNVAGGNFEKEFYQRMSTFGSKNNNSNNDNDDDDDDDDATYKIYNSNNYLNDNAVDVDISSNSNNNNNNKNSNNNIKNSSASVNYLTVY